MEILFKRRLTNELLTTYLPSLLLLLMSWAITFFKPFYFEAAVTVNLSILLVTTTLFIRWGMRQLFKNRIKYKNIFDFYDSVWWRSFQQLLMSVWLISGSYLDNFIHLFREKIYFSALEVPAKLSSMSWSDLPSKMFLKICFWRWLSFLHIYCLR